MKSIDIKTEKLPQADVERINDVVKRMRIQSLETHIGPIYTDAEFVGVEAVISGFKFALQAYIPPTASNTLIKNTTDSLLSRCIAEYILSEAKKGCPLPTP